MRKSLVSALGGAVLASLAAQPAAAAPDPFALYGGRIAFDVLRDGEPVGTATTRFSGDKNDLQVDLQMSLEVSILYLLSYKMTYAAREHWRGGKLAALDVDVERGGDSHRIDGQRVDDRFRWTGPAGTQSAALPLMPTNHWNAEVLQSTRVLNTLTGAVNRVAITRRELETVQTGDGPRPAYRYSYQGDLNNDVWYDRQGRWVKLRFKASDGSTIEYVCRQCGTTAPQTSKQLASNAP